VVEEGSRRTILDRTHVRVKAGTGSVDKLARQNRHHRMTNANREPLALDGRRG
jgi:hypothetical protein